MPSKSDARSREMDFCRSRTCASFLQPPQAPGILARALRVGCENAAHGGAAASAFQDLRAGMVPHETGFGSYLKGSWVLDIGL